MFFLVGAAVHYRPGVALGFGSGSVISRTTNTKTRCYIGWVVNPNPYRAKNGGKNRIRLPPKVLRLKLRPILCFV